MGKVGRKVSGREKLPRCVGFLHGKLNLASKIYEGRTPLKELHLKIKHLEAASAELKMD